MTDAQKAEPADENLCRLRTTVYVASQVGSQLGGREILLEALSFPAAAGDGMTGGFGESAAAKRNPGHSIVITPSDKT